MNSPKDVAKIIVGLSAVAGKREMVNLSMSKAVEDGILRRA
jgi:hypothetical protein